MKQKPIVDRLKEAGCKRVYGALEFAGLKDRPDHLPAFFVVPEGWTATPNQLAGAHDQRTSESFGVVIMLHEAPRRDDAVSEELETEERRVIDALAGWTHPDASRACDAAGGRLLSVSGSTLSWMVSFRTSRHIRVNR